MTEKLRQVKSFSELRAGSLVVVKCCSWCGRNHRGMLTGIDSRRGLWPDGTYATLPGWDMMPNPHGESSSGFQVTARCIGEGRLYLVDTGELWTTATRRRASMGVR